MGWSGDASGDYSQEGIIVPMVRPVSVIATFSDDVDDDGLLNTNETALGTDPCKKESVMMLGIFKEDLKLAAFPRVGIVESRCTIVHLDSTIFVGQGRGLRRVLPRVGNGLGRISIETNCHFCPVSSLCPF